MADVSEDGGEVTFVAGQAVEQETSGETPDGDHGDERAAAMAAVKEALEAEGKKAAKEAKDHREKDPLVPRDRDADGKFVPGDPVAKEKAAAVKKLETESGETEPPEKDESASALKKALAERAATAKYKAEANAELERGRAEVRKVYQELQAEKAKIEAEKQRLALFRKDPVRAIRENGWDNPEEFILDIAQDGTPEGQARRQQREMQQELRELREWKQQQAQEALNAKEQQAQQQAAAFRQHVMHEFLNTTFAKNGDDDAYPHIATLYKGREASLITEADVVAKQYRDATGKEASFKDIAEYLEECAVEWYKKVSGRAKAAPPVTQGRPTPGSATGKKSLSPAGSSERRTLGTVIADLDGDERLEAARTAVRAAIHATGER